MLHIKPFQRITHKIKEIVLIHIIYFKPVSFLNRGFVAVKEGIKQKYLINLFAYKQFVLSISQDHHPKQIYIIECADKTNYNIPF